MTFDSEMLPTKYRIRGYERPFDPEHVIELFTYGGYNIEGDFLFTYDRNGVKTGHRIHTNVSYLDTMPIPSYVYDETITEEEQNKTGEETMATAAETMAAAVETMVVAAETMAAAASTSVRKAVPEEEEVIDEWQQQDSGQA
jgi:hypothetical protein